MNAFLRLFAAILATLGLSSLAFAQDADTTRPDEPLIAAAPIKPLVAMPNPIVSTDRNRYPKLRVGQVCSYHETDPLNKVDRLWTETVTEVTDEKTVIRVQTNRGFHDRWYDVSGNLSTVFSLGNRTRTDFRPVVQYYRWPLSTAMNSWNVSYSFPITYSGYSGIKQVNLTAKVEGVETVAVGGQTFSAFRISYIGSYTDHWETGLAGAGMPGTGQWKETFWLALGAPCPRVKYAKWMSNYTGSSAIILTKELVDVSHAGD